MNRRPSNSIPELPPPPRRKRGLSDEERALWESVAKQVKPLRKRHRVAKPPAALPEAEAPAAPKPVASPKPPAPPKISTPPRPHPPPPAPIGPPARPQLPRGRKRIDAPADLHGITQARAHSRAP